MTNACPNCGYVDPKLSDREMEVLNRLVRGMRSREIGKDLDLSFKTVETHRSNIYAKLKLRSVVEMVHWAIREGYLVIEPKRKPCLTTSSPDLSLSPSSATRQ